MDEVEARVRIFWYWNRGGIESEAPYISVRNADERGDSTGARIGKFEKGSEKYNRLTPVLDLLPLLSPRTGAYCRQYIMTLAEYETIIGGDDD